MDAEAKRQAQAFRRQFVWMLEVLGSKVQSSKSNRELANLNPSKSQGRFWNFNTLGYHAVLRRR